IVPLVVAEHGYVDAGRRGGLPDCRAFGGSNLTPVDRERYGPRGLRGCNRHTCSIRPAWVLRQPKIVRDSGHWATVKIQAAFLVVTVNHRAQPGRGEPCLAAGGERERFLEQPGRQPVVRGTPALAQVVDAL